MSYRNIYYKNRTNEIIHKGWDKDGKRIENRSKFKPFLMLETDDASSRYASIFGTRLKTLQFDSTKKRRDFVDSYNDRIFFNLSPEQQYALLNIKNDSLEEMNQHPLKIYYLDIEVHSPDEFPEADSANHPINIISIYNSLDGKIYSWGTKEIDDLSSLQKKFNNDYVEDIDENSFQYNYCETEVDLLESFLNFWKNDYPDIVTGWNSSFFDIPYVYNRIVKILSEPHARRLSPYGDCRLITTTDKYQNLRQKYSIKGLDCIDYLNLYDVFTFFAGKESYKLDFIANLELDIGKIEYEESNLAKLADKNWDRFVLYNFQDVKLLAGLEKKLKFLELARTCSYMGFASFEDALGKKNIILGALAKEALKDGKFLYTGKPSSKENYEGGFVKEAIKGLHRNVVSYDITSLYPTNMMCFNTSIETKRGKITFQNDERVEFTFKGVSKKCTPKEFKEFLVSKNCCITPYGIIFDQSIKGIVPKFVESVFNKKNDVDVRRKEIKSDSDWKSNIRLLKEYELLEIKRSVYKVIINSVYGVLGSQYFPLFDIDIAQSITLCGQSVIKKTHDLVNTDLRKKFKLEQDLTIGGDTDSFFMTIEPIVEKMGIKVFDDNKLFTEDARQLFSKIDKWINVKINDWVKKEFNVNNPNYVFNREKVCPTAIFLAKKNYAYWVLNNEDAPTDKIAYTGLRTIKSEYSDTIKNTLDSIYKFILYKYTSMDKQELRKALNEHIEGLRDTFLKSGIVEQSKRQKANNIEKYLKGFDGFKSGKGCPVQVKASINYNKLLKVFGIENDYENIGSGNKVKWTYLKPNKFNLEVIGFLNEFPKEFEKDLKPDVDKQFQVLAISAMEKLYEVLDWQKPNFLKKEIDLEELFS